MHSLRKTLEEIRRIASNQDRESILELSQSELQVLISILNRYRVSLPEQDAFADFYLEVASRIAKPTRK